MSTQKPIRVLMLEDNESDAELLAHQLCRQGFSPQWQRVDTKEEYLHHLNDSIDIIFSDYRMPKFSTEEAFDLLKQKGLDIPFLILSGAIGEEVAAGLIKKGVTDYLLKDRLGRLGGAVATALNDKQLREENRRALKALEENEARYRSLVQAMSRSVWIANAEGDTISGSFNWRSYTGQAWDQAKGRGWLEAVHPDDRERVVTALTKALAAKTVYESEYRVRAVDGTYGYFLARAVPVMMDDGSVREWVGTTTDITQQKQAEIRNAAFSSLGQNLSTAVKPHEAAKTIADVADKLLGWDCCTLDLYLSAQNIVYPLITVDCVDGKRTDVTPVYVGRPPTPRMKNIINNGPLLILRDQSARISDSIVFGDTNRLSLSIMAVPIRNGSRVVGILSVQSYAQNAYDESDLETLQILADYCGGALERIKAEQSLRESEERFRQMAENIRELFWLADPTANELIYASPAYETIWGRTLESLHRDGKSSLDAVLPEDRPLMDAYLQRYKSEACEIEYRVQRPDGTIRYVRDRAFPIQDASGAVTRVAGIAEDVTDRRRARLRDAAFSSLGERLNSATNADAAARIIVEVADTLFGWDSCFLSLYSAQNNSVRSLLNIDIIDGKKQAVPSTLKDKPSARMLETVRQGGQLILRSHLEENVDGMVPFGSGRLSASIMLVPIRAMTEVIGVFSIQSYALKAYSRPDLDTLQALADYCGGALKRIAAEERLAYQANLLMHVNDAILSTDDAFVVTSWNQAAHQMYGWKTEEAIGRKLEEVVPMELTSAQREEMQQALGTTGNYRLEAKHFRRDRQPLYIESTIIVLRDESGKTTGYVSANRDATKRHQLEEQLRQAQKMEAFGQLAGGVAHDFNNILTVIGGYTNLLIARGNLDKEVVEELSLIAAASDKASNLTRQLLTFSRKKEMQLSATKVNDVVGNMTKMLHRVIGEEIKLQLVYSPGLPEIAADPSMLEQVLLNLAINARDAMLPRGGQLMISTALIQIGESYPNPEAQRGDCICLCVRDTGCGMTPETQARIFEPFFTTKGIGKGTGLGLATVYGIVKQHRGWIEVNSQVGAGTTFKVFLPVKGGTKTEVQPKKAETDVRGGNETILLVEDEIGVRGLAKQILQRHGYRVLEAENGPKAISVWQQHHQEIALMVTDMVMPGGMNGRELALKLQEQRPSFKVIYVSGYSVNLSEFELNEGWNFLQKPYQPKKLAKTIRDRLDEK